MSILIRGGTVVTADHSCCAYVANQAVRIPALGDIPLATADL